MISDSSNFDRGTLQVAGDGGKVGVNLPLQFGRSEEGEPVFGGENRVKVDLVERLRHGIEITVFRRRFSRARGVSANPLRLLQDAAEAVVTVAISGQIGDALGQQAIGKSVGPGTSAHYTERFPTAIFF